MSPPSKPWRKMLSSSFARGTLGLLMAHTRNDLDKARQLLLDGDSAQALALYQRLVRERPQEAVIWYEYGNAAFQMRQMELADRAWSKTMELKSQNAELIGMVGHQYQAARRPD